MTEHAAATKRPLTPAEVRERGTITVDEWAAFARCGRTQAYEAVRDGSVPSIRVGRRYFIPAGWALKVTGWDDAA